jgi:hypothetical protein
MAAEAADPSPSTAPPIADTANPALREPVNPTAALPAQSAPSGPSGPAQVSSAPAVETRSPLVHAVIRMTTAGVSVPVVKTYVECSSSIELLTDADIIALKQSKVPDEIVTVLVKQTAQARAQDVQQKNEAVARVLATRRARFGGMDPESYDYFQYYYLHPRALASAYQRLSPYGPWGPYRYGSAPGYGYHPYGHAWHRY